MNIFGTYGGEEVVQLTADLVDWLASYLVEGEGLLTAAMWAF